MASESRSLAQLTPARLQPREIMEIPTACADGKKAVLLDQAIKRAAGHYQDCVDKLGGLLQPNPG